jgi:hypothetical protein
MVVGDKEKTKRSCRVNMSCVVSMYPLLHSIREVLDPMFSNVRMLMNTNIGSFAASEL